MGRLSPAIELAPEDFPRHPEVGDWWRISPEGYCESVQGTRVTFETAPADLARTLLQNYCLQIGELARFQKFPGRLLPPVRCEELAGGSVRFQSGPLTLIEMGAVETANPHPSPLSPSGDFVASPKGEGIASPPGRGRLIAPGEGFLATRPVLKGLMVAKGEEGRAALGVRVRPAPGQSSELLIELRLADYRPALRGTGDKARFREWLYKKTQLGLHGAVGKRFLLQSF